MNEFFLLGIYRLYSRDVLCYNEILSLCYNEIISPVSRINVFYWNSHRRIAYRASTLHKVLLKRCWQKFIKDKRAFKLNLSRQNNSKTSSWSTISYNLKEVESLAFQLTRCVCLKSQAGRFGRGEFAEFAKYFLTLDKRIIKINLL